MHSSRYASAGHYEPQDLLCWMIGGPGKTESEGKKVLGPSMIICRRTVTMWALRPTTVKAPNIAHLSLLASVRYNKKETNLKYLAHSNKVINVLYLHSVWNEKCFPDLEQF